MYYKVISTLLYYKAVVGALFPALGSLQPLRAVKLRSLQVLEGWLGMALDEDEVLRSNAKLAFRVLR